MAEAFRVQTESLGEPLICLFLPQSTKGTTAAIVEIFE